MKTIVKVFLFLLALSLLFFFRSQFFYFRTNENLSEHQRKILLAEASSSLMSEDVPVGALLLFNDSIIGEGYNTVYRDSNAGGHAEINAISSAIQKIGFSAFSKLDRKKLVLVSTFEPCMMCKGAIMEYNIKQLYFLKGKGLLHWLKEDIKQIRYEWNKRQSDGSELQDSLFMLHPKYRK
jgi:tRNA(Arg) A34 adenosine deaminase TadA